MIDMKKLKMVRMNLKSGEYEGEDIMLAWIAIDALFKVKEREASLFLAMEEILDGVTAHELSECTGWSEEKCQSWFDLMEQIRGEL